MYLNMKEPNQQYYDIVTRNKFLSLFLKVGWEEFTPRRPINPLSLIKELDSVYLR